MKIQVNSQVISLIKNDDYQEVNAFLEQEFTKIGILVDTNTHQQCLPRLLARLKTEIPIEIIEIPAGEQEKDLETCMGIWESLSDLDFDRNSLLINLGGGVLTDIGGFVAAAFKRGISFINIPTTLLAMVDAAVGGKTGVNLGALKNQIGVIEPADLVVIDSSYLQTLSSQEMRSGLAEMLKHGLIADEAYWRELGGLSEKGLEDLDDLIVRSIQIKSEIVARDPHEKGLRKSLNFGHTLGHAIESFFLASEEKPKLLNGEAVAIGMLMESYISSRILDLSPQRVQEISRRLLGLYSRVEISQQEWKQILDLLKYDKKNKGGRINFVLLRDIADPSLDCEVTPEILEDAYQYYTSTE